MRDFGKMSQGETDSAGRTGIATFRGCEELRELARWIRRRPTDGKRRVDEIVR